MHRHRGVHRHALRRQRGRVGSKIAFGGFAVHSPGQCGVAAKCFLIDKVSPAANALADQKTHCHQIKHLQKRNLAPFARKAAKHKRADERAVNGNAAVAQIDHFPQALVLKRRHGHIINACAHNGHHCADHHHIHHTVGVDAEIRPIAEGKQQAAHKARRQNDAIPVNIKAAQGNGHTVNVQAKPQARKLYQIDHCFSPLTYSFAFYASAG